MRRSDQEIVELCRRGRPEGFASLLLAYQAGVYARAYSFVRHREDALDLTQEVFLRVIDGIQRFDAGRPLWPWLRRITTNLCLNHIRGRGHPEPLEIPLGEDGHGAGDRAALACSPAGPNDVAGEVESHWLRGCGTRKGAATRRSRATWNCRWEPSRPACFAPGGSCGNGSRASWRCERMAERCAMDDELLQEYLDGALDDAVRLVLEEHLRECARCRRELVRFKLLFWELEHRPPEAEPAELDAVGDRLMQAWNERQAARGGGQASSWGRLAWQGGTGWIGALVPSGLSATLGSWIGAGALRAFGFKGTARR